MAANLAPFLLTAAIAASPSSPGFTPTDRLRVNTDDAIQYVARATLEEGLAALEEVVFTSDREEAWMHDPRSGEWLEIGQDASGWQALSIGDLQDGVMRARNSARIDPTRFASLRGRTSAEIHIHPVQGDPGYRLARAQEDYRTGAALLEAIKITRAPPSTDDLKEMLREVVIAGADSTPFAFYFGSYGGVTRFSLTARGRAHVQSLLAGMTLAQLERGQDLPAPACEYAAGIRERIVADINAHASARSGQEYGQFLDDAFTRSSDDLIRIRYAPYRRLATLFDEREATSTR